MRHKVWIKDIRKNRQLIDLHRICGYVTHIMSPQELFKYMTAEYIMDYKLLLHRINKRLENGEREQSKQA